MVPAHTDAPLRRHAPHIIRGTLAPRRQDDYEEHTRPWRPARASAHRRTNHRPDAFPLLKNLKAVHYAGAPLSITAGRALAPHVQIVPAIGSTDAGAYYTETVNSKGSEDWDYVRFKPHSGLVLEPRVDGMHELVFVRNPECWMQPVFDLHPEWERFETKDLWVEHPVRKGTWKTDTDNHGGLTFASAF